MASHSMLQNLPDVGTHEQIGCAHFSAFSVFISFLPTLDQERTIQAPIVVIGKKSVSSQRNTARDRSPRRSQGSQPVGFPDPIPGIVVARSRVMAPALGFLEDFFHLPDLLLDLPANLFADTFGLQVRIVRQFAQLLLNLALHFVNLAFDLMLGTRLHPVASVSCRKFVSFCASACIPSLHRQARTQRVKRSIEFPYGSSLSRGSYLNRLHETLHTSPRGTIVGNRKPVVCSHRLTGRSYLLISEGNERGRLIFTNQ